MTHEPVNQATITRTSREPGGYVIHLTCSVKLWPHKGLELVTVNGKVVHKKITVTASYGSTVTDARKLRIYTLDLACNFHRTARHEYYATFMRPTRDEERKCTRAPRQPYCS